MENIADLYELSPMQQGMLFHTLYSSESGLYFEQLSCTIKGNLNVWAFKQAWSKIVARHSILRTSFHWEELDKPLQVVHLTVDLPWNEHDWRNLTVKEQQEQLEGWLKSDRASGFELDTAPLMRCTLIQLAEQTYQFIWSHHHLLTDGWCLSILFKEVLAFYEAFDQGEKLYLSTPRPYRDYILWLQQQDNTQAETFWRKSFQGFKTPTPLIKDSLRSSENTGEKYDEQQLRFSTELTNNLQSFARQHRLTLNTLIQGAWGVLLSRYSGAEDVVFGTTVSGRPPSLPGAEDMVGAFINTLPVRMQCEPVELLPWLKQLQAQQVEREQYSYTSLVDIQGWSEVPREMPLFKSLVVFENYPVDASLQQWQGDLEISAINAVERTNYPLTVVAGIAEELVIKFIYDRNDISQATIKRMMGHLQTLLEGMIAKSDQLLSELPLLTTAEQEQLLEWNNTKVDYPSDKCIHELFELQVAKTSDAVAVVYKNQQLTYTELNAKANQLAHHLKKLGVGKETLVGVCCDRTLETIIALLAILKAGGAYVPLDPTYPAQRLAFMLNDAVVEILITQQNLVAKLPKSNAQLLCLDTDWETICDRSEQNLINRVKSDNLAYVIYTSGSTGTPKGVTVPHRAISRLLFNTNYIQIDSSDKFAQVANVSFDAATFEIWGALLHGAKLVIIERDIVLSPQDFAECIREQEISILFLTTALFERLASQVPQAFGSLKYLLFGGETVNTQRVREVLENNPPQKLLHVYGPTENTTFSSWYLVESVHLDLTNLPIGQPIANTQVYILNRTLQPVPVGVPGEIYIAGDGLARGYLNQPELTAEKFISNPFMGRGAEERRSRGETTAPISPAPQPPSPPAPLLYKTGDLAKYQPNGNIEFLGRIDNQVKIRGFRIELGEIEAVLNQHPQVNEAVVLVREISDRQHLVSYLVTQESLDLNILRTFLKEKLPEYMLPSAFVQLEALPLTANGKVDRNALPTPEKTDFIQTKFELPRTPTEEILVNIWAEVLSLKQVGIDDNFFELGGHSLLATQLISRLRQTFSLELSLSSLFDAPTIREHSQVIEAAQKSEKGIQIPAIELVSRLQNLPLSFAQQRLWFLNQLEGESSAYNMPTALVLDGELRRTALELALNEIVQRHEALRTSFKVIDSYPVQVIADPQSLPLSIVDLQYLPTSEQSAEVEKRALAEAQKPFDLTKSPLLRVTLLQLGEDSHVLLVNMHHIISDGWSIGIFIRELSVLYQAFISNTSPHPPIPSSPSQRLLRRKTTEPALTVGQSLPLPPLPIQYADFAHWQRKYLTGEILDNQLQYWKQQLAGVPPILELPTDYPRPPVQTFKGSTHKFELDRALTEQLKTLSQQSSATLFMTLLAAFSVLLARYSNQEDIVVGSPIANRNHREIEPLIGFFVNTLMLRTNLEDNPTFAELLERVRETALDAYQYQDLPFERLVEELQPDRDLDRNPLVQVVFALQNAPTSYLSLPDLNISPLEFDYRSVRFDLEFHLWDLTEGLGGYFIYNSDLFDDSTIARIANNFQTLLQAIVTNPEQQVYSLPLLSAAEQHQILTEWNNTSINYPLNRCIHQLFEDRAKQTPDAVAVVYEGEQLSYQELNQKANKLARHLQTLGVKPETLVGICVDHSLDFIVGVLGILKAGGAYVPLDPSYPQARLSYMLSDSQVSVLLTQQGLLARLTKHQAEIVCLDRDWQVISEQSKANLTTDVTTDNLAYVIYTSGSTGNPKGVLVAHKNLLNLVFWHQDTFKVKSADRATQLAKTAFDASVWEIFPYLAAGASIHLVKPELLNSPLQLQNWLITQQISIAFLPTPLAEELLPLEWSPNIALRIMLVGGDRLQQYPPVPLPFKVINNYGPTENTVVTTSGEVTNSQHSRKFPTIGKAIANTQVYILDSHLQSVPIGVAGELHIAGDSLARGYLNRLGLTEAKFIPNPIVGTYHGTSLQQQQLYKTGDRACYLPNGNIEFLGRIDNQVKLRGFRIELGEIESALLKHSAVQKAIVAMDENNKRLIAYIVPQKNHGTDEKAIAPGEINQAEHLDHWQTLYEQTYSQSPTHQDLTFNIIGWNSSYTGQPIPEEEMRTWVENTVERILQLKPKRVLEIGCGTGLLLSRIAPHCSQYWATDYSASAINYIQQLKQSMSGLDRVTLLQKMADDFEGIDIEVDTVIINSVIQYFPSVEYLLRVLSGSLKVVSQGSIFIGDVRSLPLLEAYYASIELEQASSLSVEQLRQRMQQRIETEEELVIDPAFFIALKQHFPKITQVEIKPKRGRDRNELTKFRYDVILQVGITPSAHNLNWQNWQDNLTVSTISKLLKETSPEVLAIKNIADARLTEAVKLVNLLKGDCNLETVNQLRSTLLDSQTNAIEPEDLRHLSQDYNVSITSNHSDAGCYEVIFQHNSSLKVMSASAIATLDKIKPWSSYVNNPLQNNSTTDLIPKLRSYLQQTLPEYTIPAEFVTLPALPLTPNGKIDKRALPTPKSDRDQSSFVAPRDNLEWQLAQIWSEVLGIASVSINDNFFDLGGHSLLSVRLMGQIEQQFGKNLPLAILFQRPTIEHLAGFLRQQTDSLPWTPLVPIQPQGFKTPFFCVPGAGGNVIYFNHLARHLGSDRPFYGLQSVGLDGMSEPLTQVKDIAAYHIKAIQTVQPQGPYYMGGHSFGAKVAWEMSQQLQASGHKVALLAIFDAPAPSSTDKPVGTDWDDAMWLTQIASVVERLVGENLDISYKYLQFLEPEAQLNYFQEQLQRVNLLPANTETKLARGLVKVYQANCQADYELPQEFYPTPIILFRAHKNDFEDNDDLNSQLQQPAWGWNEFSQMPADVYTVSGDHITIMNQTNVQVLAKQLKANLDRADSNKQLSIKRTTKTIRILLVDDQNIVRQGIQALLEPNPKLKIVGTAENGHDAIEQVKILKPNVVLMDIEMPGMSGITASRKICQQFPNVKVLILSSHDSKEYIAKALKVGVQGYLLKSTLAADLEKAILSVYRGNLQIESKLLKKVLTEDSHKTTALAASNGPTLQKKQATKVVSPELHSNRNIRENVAVNQRKIGAGESSQPDLSAEKSKLLSSKKWWLAPLLVVSILSIAAITLFRFNRSEPVATTPVVSTPKIRKVAGLGRIEPEGEVMSLSAPTSLEAVQVEQLLIKIGDRVEKGEIIAILDGRQRQQAALDEAKTKSTVAAARLEKVKAGAKQGTIAAKQAAIANLQAELAGETQAQRANLAKLTAELDNAQTEFQRHQRLYSQGAISASALDSKRLTFQTAQEQLNQAKASLDRTQRTLEAKLAQAQATLEETTEVRPVDIQIAEAELNQAEATVARAQADMELAYVRSPVDGEILDIHTRPGEALSQKGIAEIGQTDRMMVVAEIDQNDISKVKIGQQAAVISGVFTEELQGKVHQVGSLIGKKDILDTDPAADEDGRVVEVEILLEPEDSQKVAKLTNLEVDVVIEL